MFVFIYIYLAKSCLTAVQAKGFKKIMENAASAKPGSRAYPNPTKDAAVGFRLDWGEEIQDDSGHYRNVKLQVNKNAEDATLKKLAGKDSHRVYATARVSLDANDSTTEDDLLDVLVTQGKANAP